LPKGNGSPSQRIKLETKGHPTNICNAF